MSVTDTWSDWSATAADNAPAGSNTPEIDDELRNIKAQCKTNLMALADVQIVTAKKTFNVGKLAVASTAAGYLYGGTDGIVTYGNVISTANETTQGLVELASTAEAITGTDTARAVTPAGLKAAISDALPSIKGAFSNLVIEVQSDTTVDVNADAVILEDSSNTPYTARSVNLTLDISTSGANGLDTGSVANSTWYAVHVIYNSATDTVAGLLSLSQTSPSLPSGYTFSGRVGWVYTDADSDLLRFLKQGKDVQLVVDGSTTKPLLIATGPLGNYYGYEWAAVSIDAVISPTATMIKGVMTGGNTAIAPNSNYTNNSGDSPGYAGIGESAAAYWLCPFEFMLESRSIYCVLLSDKKIYIHGWREE